MHFQSPQQRASLVYALFDPREGFSTLYIGETSDLKRAYRSHMNIAKQHCERGFFQGENPWYDDLYPWIIAMLEDTVVPNVAILEHADPQDTSQHFMKASWKYLAYNNGWNVKAYTFHESPYPELLSRVNRLQWNPISVLEGWDLVSSKFRQHFGVE